MKTHRTAAERSAARAAMIEAATAARRASVAALSPSLLAFSLAAVRREKRPGESMPTADDVAQWDAHKCALVHHPDDVMAEARATLWSEMLRGSFGAECVERVSARRYKRTPAAL